MSSFEYRSVPAPERCLRLGKVERGEDRFCLTFDEVLNQQAAEGWEFVRIEALPSRSGFWPFRHRLRTRHLLIFRRDRRRLLPIVSSKPRGRDSLVIPSRFSKSQTIESSEKNAVVKLDGGRQNGPVIAAE